MLVFCISYILAGVDHHLENRGLAIEAFLKRQTAKNRISELSAWRVYLDVGWVM
jgi:hypothetical protein